MAQTYSFRRPRRLRFDKERDPVRKLSSRTALNYAIDWRSIARLAPAEPRAAEHDFLLLGPWITAALSVWRRRGLDGTFLGALHEDGRIFGCFSYGDCTAPVVRAQFGAVADSSLIPGGPFTAPLLLSWLTALGCWDRIVVVSGEFSHIVPMRPGDGKEHLEAEGIPELIEGFAERGTYLLNALAGGPGRPIHCLLTGIGYLFDPRRPALVEAEPFYAQVKADVLDPTPGNCPEFLPAGLDGESYVCGILELLGCQGTSDVAEELARETLRFAGIDVGTDEELRDARLAEFVRAVDRSPNWGLVDDWVAMGRATGADHPITVCG